MRKAICTTGLAFAFAALTMAGTAAAMNCTIHPKKGATQSQLEGMTKVSKETAQEAAVASLKSSVAPASVESELEVEHGCLIYSFDIGLPKGTGVEEVSVDAGTGKVLTHHHESAKSERAEKAKEAKEKPPGTHSTR